MSDTNPIDKASLDATIDFCKQLKSSTPISFAEAKYQKFSEEFIENHKHQSEQ